MVATAVRTLGGFFVAMFCGARVVIQAGVLGCDMWASTSTATISPGALCRLMPPVLALEALQWPRDIYANTACNTTEGEVLINGCVSGCFGFKAYHQRAMRRFCTGLFAVEPGEISDVKVEGTDIAIGLFDFPACCCHLGLVRPDCSWGVVRHYGKSAVGGGGTLVDQLDPVVCMRTSPGRIILGLECEDDIAIW